MNPSSFSITLSSCGNSIKLSEASSYRILSYKGITSGSYVINSPEYSILDGSSVQGRRIASREIVLSFEVVDYGNTDAHRASLMTFFNPKESGTLKVTRGNRSRKTDYEVMKVEFEQKTIFSPLTVTVSLFCPLPYFADPSKSVVSGDTAIPLFTFPFNSVKDVGIMSGVIKQLNSFSVNNPGDIPVGITAYITVTGDGVVNPNVSCGDESLKILDTPSVGDSYIVSTVAGKKKILKNQKAFFSFDRNSSFFSLKRGASQIDISADSSPEFIESYIEIDPWYLGI